MVIVEEIVRLSVRVIALSRNYRSGCYRKLLGDNQCLDKKTDNEYTLCMENLEEKYLELNSFAVAGSFQSPEKYAYMIFTRLKNQEKQVFPVHPALEELEGQRCYKNILEVEEPVEGLSLVTPPRATRGIVKQALEKGIRYIWMQPGAEDDEAIAFCEKNGIQVIHHNCLLVWMSRLWR